MAPDKKAWDLSTELKRLELNDDGILGLAFGRKKAGDVTIPFGYFCPAEYILSSLEGKLSPDNEEFKIKPDKEGGCYLATKDGRSNIYLSNEDIKVIGQEYGIHIHQTSDVSKLSGNQIKIEV